MGAHAQEPEWADRCVSSGFVPNYFLFRPWDYDAKERCENPDAKKKTYTNIDFFSQIRDDWRHMPDDEKLREAHVLGNRETTQNI